MNIASSPRRYRSTLRAEQALDTRRRIIDAVGAQVSDGGLDALSVGAVAKRASVSVPTIYSHFPTKEALLDAFWDTLRERFDWGFEPASADDIPARLPAMFARLDKSGPLVRASFQSGAGREVRSQTRAHRMKVVEDALGDVLGPLPMRDRRRAAAVIQLLLSSAAWATMTENWGLKGAEAGSASAWAIRVLLAELRRNPNTLEGGVK